VPYVIDALPIIKHYHWLIIKARLRRRRTGAMLVRNPVQPIGSAHRKEICKSGKRGSTTPFGGGPGCGGLRVEKSG